MQNKMRTLLTGAAAAVVTTSLLLAGFGGSQKVAASSHREAPLITQDQTADNTDVFAFVSPDRPNSVTLISDFIPLEEPSIGPNFYRFDDNVVYQIRLDNNGDARLDLALQFRFRTTTTNGDTFLYNTGPITSLTSTNWNVKQVMDVTAQIRQGDPATPTFTSFTLGTGLPTPPVNIGPRSTPNYETNLAEASISTISPGPNAIKVFAGQRDEPFYIDTGSAFDLLGVRPFNAAHAIPLAASNGVDSLAGYNVHTIAIQLPTQLLTANAQLPTSANDPNAIIGVYSTASRPGDRVLNLNGTATTNGDCSGTNANAPSATCVQVSRLANPLVNELFIPQGTSTTTSENDKDLYNAQLPATDVNRVTYILGSSSRPVEPVNLLNSLYASAVKPAPTSGRVDLVRVFLTGVPGLNRPPFVADPNDPSGGLGAATSDLMRLNTAIPATAPGSVNRLGVIGGDLAGYPNGRRPQDDVVDITLRVGEGVLLPGNACSGGTQNCNQSPNNILGDGVNESDRPFRTTFPYLASPVSGYEDQYHGRTGSADTTTPGPAPSPVRP